METKICTKCGIEKEINKFKRFKSYNGKYYYTGDCKQCRNLDAYEHNKEYRLSHKEQIALLKKKNYIKNREKVVAKHKKYYEKHKEEIKQKVKNWSLNNKEKIKERRRKKYIENREAILKDKYEYKKNRLKTDKMFKIKEQTRNMIRTAFRTKGFVKNQNTQQILGCDLDYFYKYLLQTYKENYDVEWNAIEPVHIDHKKPLKYATTKEEVIKLCHYTNLQLLKAKDNILKSDKLNWKLKKHTMSFIKTVG